jgi:hypothetical protein
MNINNNSTQTDQSIYESYNNFLFSSDRNVFFKMLKRIKLFEKVKNLNGDIVECGVFKGAGIAIWLKLLDRYSPHDIRKVIGFDFFDSSFVKSLSGKDEEMMSQVFSRCAIDDGCISLETISDKLTNTCKLSQDRFQLVKGDISITSKEYVDNRPGFRISLLYLDLDLEEPTYNALCNLYPRIVKGGVIVFDEHCYHGWSESNAVDRFAKEHGLKICKTNIQSPTAFCIKD